MANLLSFPLIALWYPAYPHPPPRRHCSRRNFTLAEPLFPPPLSWGSFTIPWPPWPVMGKHPDLEKRVLVCAYANRGNTRVWTAYNEPYPFPIPEKMARKWSWKETDACSYDWWLPICVLERKTEFWPSVEEEILIHGGKTSGGRLC